MQLKMQTEKPLASRTRFPICDIKFNWNEPIFRTLNNKSCVAHIQLRYYCTHTQEKNHNNRVS